MRDKFGTEISIGDKVKYNEGAGEHLIVSTALGEVWIYDTGVIRKRFASSIEVTHKASYEKLPRWQHMDIVRVDTGKMYYRNEFYDSERPLWMGLGTCSPHLETNNDIDEADRWIETQNPVLIVRNGRPVSG